MLFVVIHFCLFRILHFHYQRSPEGLRGRAEWCSAMEGPSGLKSATWLRPLHRGHGHLVKLARHTLAVCPIWKDTTSFWMGPLSMAVLWLEGYQLEQRKFKGQLCWSFICNSHLQTISNWKGDDCQKCSRLVSGWILKYKHVNYCRDGLKSQDKQVTLNLIQLI